MAPIAAASNIVIITALFLIPIRSIHAFPVDDASSNGYTSWTNAIEDTDNYYDRLVYLKRNGEDVDVALHWSIVMMPTAVNQGNK